MKLNSKLIGSGLITVDTCALVGSITGTFAWYGYSTRATATLTGTSFDEAANLQLGIVTQYEYENNLAFDESAPEVPYDYDNRDNNANANWKTKIKETVSVDPDSGENVYTKVVRNIDSLAEADDKNICWSPIGGGLREAAIKAYLDEYGYSTGSMRPSTSGRTTKDVLIDNPNYDDTQPENQWTNPSKIASEEDIDIQPKEMSIYQYDGKEDAEQSDYVVIPLALRVSDLKGDFKDNVDIFLSDVDASILTEGKENNNLKKGLRVDFKVFHDESDVKHTILNPGSSAVEGKTALGGLLDLNRDGYVDVDKVDYEYAKRSELLYGAVKSVVWDEHNVENPAYDPNDTTSTEPQYVMVANPDYDATYNNTVPELIPETAKTLYDHTDAIDLDNYDFPIHLSNSEADYAKRYHQRNTYTVKSFEAYEQSWKGDNNSVDGLIAKFDDSLRLEHGTAIANTGDEKLVYCTLTIWIEGWDEAIDSSILDVEYGLGLQFQVNRVD